MAKMLLKLSLLLISIAYVQSFLWNVLGCPWCSAPLSTSSMYTPYMAYQAYPSAIIINSQPPSQPVITTYRQPISYRVVQPSYSYISPSTSASASYQSPYYQNNYQPYYHQPARSPYKMSYQELAKRYESTSAISNPNTAGYQTSPYDSQYSVQSQNPDNGMGLITHAPLARARNNLKNEPTQRELQLLERMSKQHHLEMEKASRAGTSEDEHASKDKLLTTPDFEGSDSDPKEDDHKIKKTESSSATNEMKQAKSKNIDDLDIDLDYPEKGGKEPELPPSVTGEHEADMHMRTTTQKDETIHESEFVPIGKDSHPSKSSPVEETKLNPNVIEDIKKKLKEKDLMEQNEKDKFLQNLKKTEVP